MEEYIFKFGPFKGKTIKDISLEEDGFQKLQNHRKSLMNFIKKPFYEKHKVNNEKELHLIEEFLLEHGHILTDFEAMDLSKKPFKELIKIFEDKILEGYDKKVQKKSFIRMDYKDYLCLRYSELTYTELLETQNTQLLLKVISSI